MALLSNRLPSTNSRQPTGLSGFAGYQMFTCFSALLNLLDPSTRLQSLLNVSDSSNGRLVVKETETVREADGLWRDTLPCL